MPRKHKNTVAWVVAIVIIILILIGVWLVGRQRGLVPSTTHAVNPVAPATSAPPPAATAPPIAHPISAASVPAPAATVAPLPGLLHSDTDAITALKHLAGTPGVDGWLVNHHIIERIVATINALPGHTLGGDILPLHAPASTMAVRKDDGHYFIAPANAKRYAPYMKWVRAMNVKATVAWYVHWYPLFQQAYRELGIPHGYFNDRLVAVIDNLLAAPVPTGPIAVQPTATGYAFVDPKLEALSAGQKMMLHVGPANERIIRQKLQAIRAAVTGAQAPGAANHSASAH